jgi:hypothetical protein
MEKGLEKELETTSAPIPMVTRRAWIGSAFASALFMVGAGARRSALGASTAPTGILVYASPDCQCCKAWMKHLEANGFVPAAQFVNDVAPIKRKRGVPEKLWSCHTAIVGDYTVEGHVPADLIHKMLDKRLPLAGLAAPGMPNGAPGMEGPVKDRYEVISFTRAGTTEVFAVR